MFYHPVATAGKNFQESEGNLVNRSVALIQGAGKGAVHGTNEFVRKFKKAGTTMVQKPREGLSSQLGVADKRAAASLASAYSATHIDSDGDRTVGVAGAHFSTQV